MLRAQVKSLAQKAVVRATRGRIFWHGPRDVRRVAITFDDGPGELTDEYLACLSELDVPATFFVMGSYCEQLPGMVARYMRGGHQVAGHGYYHERFTNLGARALTTELARMTAAIGPLPWGKWVRPPHGSIGPRDAAVMLGSGYTVAMWSHDSRDYDGADAATLIERCAPRQIAPGDVLLFHEASPATLAALPTIVRQLEADGYELVTMADLLAA